jgi:hypothetical protein
MTATDPLQPLDDYRVARAIEPKTGRIYECNCADDRVRKSFAHYLWGESTYRFLGDRLTIVDPS